MSMLNTINARIRSTALLLTGLAGIFSACQKEIDFDYHEIAPIVVVEGRITNEGTKVTITRSRSVSDSVKGQCIPNATVVVSAEGMKQTIGYDAKADCYKSALKGTPGTTYRLDIDLDGQHYEASSFMPYPAPISSAEFLWQDIINERMLAYEVWAADPQPSERNYYWYRMDRISHHPHFVGKTSTEPYRWNVFDDRGCPPGQVYRDVMCMSERMAEEDEKENWKSILYEGDTITFQLMTIDRAVYDFFTSLRAGQGGGANPRSNITGGCLGYFAAGSVTHADTVVYHQQ